MGILFLNWRIFRKKNPFICRNFFPILMFQKNFPGVIGGPTQNLGPIGSAVLTFIGYKQTNTQTRKVYIIERCSSSAFRVLSVPPPPPSLSISYSSP